MVCAYVYNGKKCDMAQHTTSGQKLARFCTKHCKSYRKKHHTPAIKPTLAVDKAALKEKNRLKKKASRQKKATQLAAILDEELRSLCGKMAELKTRGTQYVLIDNVIKDLHVLDIKRIGPGDPINFTDMKIQVSRRMQLVPKPELNIPHVMTALKQVFPRCTNTVVKVITTAPGDKEQLLHTDFDLKNISNRVFDLDSFHYSAIIALQPETHLLIGEKKDRVDIPKNSMLLFRGDMPHAGGAYKEANASLFISLSSPFYPLSNRVYLVK
jgi:hypothetical protein